MCGVTWAVTPCRRHRRHPEDTPSGGDESPRGLVRGRPRRDHVVDDEDIPRRRGAARVRSAESTVDIVAPCTRGAPGLVGDPPDAPQHTRGRGRARAGRHQSTRRQHREVAHRIPAAPPPWTRTGRRWDEQQPRGAPLW
jgi:hypothetical protein